MPVSSPFQNKRYLYSLRRRKVLPFFFCRRFSRPKDCAPPPLLGAWHRFLQKNRITRRLKIATKGHYGYALIYMIRILQQYVYICVICLLLEGSNTQNKGQTGFRYMYMLVSNLYTVYNLYYLYIYYVSTTLLFMYSFDTLIVSLWEFLAMSFVLKSSNCFYLDAGQKETCHMCDGFKDHAQSCLGNNVQ